MGCVEDKAIEGTLSDPLTVRGKGDVTECLASQEAVEHVQGLCWHVHGQEVAWRIRLMLLSE